MNSTKDRTRLLFAALIGVSVPIIASTADTSAGLALILCAMVVLAGWLARIDFRIPLVPGAFLLLVSGVLDVASANNTAEHLAVIGASMFIMGVVLGLAQQKTSLPVVRGWFTTSRRKAHEGTPAFVALAALLCAIAIGAIVIAAFALLDHMLLAALISSVVVLIAWAMQRSPVTILAGCGMLTLVLSAFAALAGASGSRINLGTMALVFLALSSGFAFVSAMRRASDDVSVRA
jgi:hypothetical protein